MTNDNIQQNLKPNVLSNRCILKTRRWLNQCQVRIGYWRR
nr:MAG TPA: hypothetical protein [Caudoviricetes sp.]